MVDQPTSLRAKEHDPAVWAAVRKVFTELYQSGEHTLKEITGIMKRDYGFDANERQWKGKIKSWSLAKNIKFDEATFMLYKKAIREYWEGKKTAFHLNGRRVEDHRLAQVEKKFKSKNNSAALWSPETLETVRVETPIGITYYTPTSRSFPRPGFRSSRSSRIRNVRAPCGTTSSSQDRTQIQTLPTWTLFGWETGATRVKRLATTDPSNYIEDLISMNNYPDVEQDSAPSIKIPSDPTNNLFSRESSTQHQSGNLFFGERSTEKVLSGNTSQSLSEQSSSLNECESLPRGVENEGETTDLLFFAPPQAADDASLNKDISLIDAIDLFIDPSWPATINKDAEALIPDHSNLMEDLSLNSKDLFPGSEAMYQDALLGLLSEDAVDLEKWL